MLCFHFSCCITKMAWQSKDQRFAGGLRSCTCTTSLDISWWTTTPWRTHRKRWSWGFVKKWAAVNMFEGESGKHIPACSWWRCGLPAWSNHKGDEILGNAGNSHGGHAEKEKEKHTFDKTGRWWTWWKGTQMSELPVGVSIQQAVDTCSGEWFLRTI